MEIANCFLKSDGEAKGKDISSDGIGLALKCTKARGSACMTDFFQIAQDLKDCSGKDNCHLIEKAGNYKHIGYGDNSHVFIVSPNIIGKVNIQLGGQSAVYYPKHLTDYRWINCKDMDRLKHCHETGYSGMQKALLKFKKFYLSAIGSIY